MAFVNLNIRLFQEFFPPSIANAKTKKKIQH